MTRKDLEGANYHYFTAAMRRVEEALAGSLAKSDLIPDGWAEIARRTPVPVKQKITTRIDGDVLKFFRGMGTGYHTAMNDVLRAYMHARVSGVVRGAEAEGGSVLAAMEAREADDARMRERLDRITAGFEAERARRTAADAAMSEGDRRRMRLAELKAAAEGRKGR